MQGNILERVRGSAAFTQLERRRNRFGWTLTVIMLGIYVGFILAVAFAPATMGTPVAGAITLGFPIGLGVILSAVALTGLYVWRANGDFDALAETVRREARQ
jgi:uncharacterized membrane protein (DUF485 family)